MESLQFTVLICSGNEANEGDGNLASGPFLPVKPNKALSDEVPINEAKSETVER
jgi:hypothetical protein